MCAVTTNKQSRNMQINRVLSIVFSSYATVTISKYWWTPRSERDRTADLHWHNQRYFHLFCQSAGLALMALGLLLAHLLWHRRPHSSHRPANDNVFKPFFTTDLVVTSQPFQLLVILDFFFLQFRTLVIFT